MFGLWPAVLKILLQKGKSPNLYIKISWRSLSAFYASGMIRVILVTTSDIPILWMWKLRHRSCPRALSWDVAEQGCGILTTTPFCFPRRERLLWIPCIAYSPDMAVVTSDLTDSAWRGHERHWVVLVPGSGLTLSLGPCFVSKFPLNNI